MPSQKDMETSAPSTPAKSVTPATPTAPATPADTTTPLKSTSAAPASKPAINPATGTEFKDDCIVLVLGPKGTIHPMIDPKSPAGVRIFENPDAAVSEIMSSKIASTRPFAIVPLKGIF